MHVCTYVCTYILLLKCRVGFVWFVVMCNVSTIEQVQSVWWLVAHTDLRTKGHAAVCASIWLPCRPYIQTINRRTSYVQLRNTIVYSSNILTNDAFISFVAAKQLESHHTYVVSFCSLLASCHASVVMHHCAHRVSEDSVSVCGGKPTKLALIQFVYIAPTHSPTDGTRSVVGWVQ